MNKVCGLVLNGVKSLRIFASELASGGRAKPQFSAKSITSTAPHESDSGRGHHNKPFSNDRHLPLTSFIMALEPRFMFDAAGAATIDALVDHSLDAHDGSAEAKTVGDPIDAHPISSPGEQNATLIAAEQQALNSLITWLQSNDAPNQAATIFSAGAGSDTWSANFNSLREEILTGRCNFNLEIRSSNELQDTLGAYSATGTTNTPTIYLNADWLNKASADAVEAVLLEEVGHHFDHRLNGGLDSPGDEGHAFAALLLTGNANLGAVISEKDHLNLNLDGQEVNLETAAPYNIAQVHFVPMREADVQTSLKAISTSVTGNIETIISITSTSNDTVVVYDHWEDGYEPDINNPIQATTQIWGDDNTANDGLATGVTKPAGDTFDSGQTILLTNAVNPASPLTLDFDGRDRIASTKAVGVTRAGWSATPGTVLAGAVNVIDAGNAGTVYTLPIGQNVDTVATGTNRLFEYTSAHIIATQDGTTVNVDKDGNGTTDLTFTLNQGETYLVNGGLNASAKITATKGIGVYLIAGDVGSAYENRWFALTPNEQWASSYFAPVSTTLTADPAYVVLYNPNASAIDVHYETATASGTITVPASGSRTNYFLMPASAAHFYTLGSGGNAAPKFSAVSVIDADATSNATHDWSYSLVPETYLTDRFTVAWGPGYDKITGTPPVTTANGSPVWVTSAADTVLYIDSATVTVKDGSGTTITGTMVDADTYKYTVNKLQSYRLSDADKDQTGLNVYTIDGTLITAAWGEDPSIAGAGTPYLDMGTTVMPHPDYILSKTSGEANTTIYGVGVSNDNGQVQLSEEVVYTVRLTNRAVIDLYNIKLTDTITPADSATYIADSTTLTVYNPSGSKAWTINGTTQTFFDEYGNITSTVTNSSLAGSSFPMSGAGYSITDVDPSTAPIDGLKRGAVIEISYRVKIRDNINKALADGDYTVTNSVNMQGDGGVNKDKTNGTPIALTVTDGEVFLMDSSFSDVKTSFIPGTDAIGLRVVDGDQNKNSLTAETLTVTVTNTSTLEFETVTLTETGNNTGIFRNTLTTASGAVGSNNNGTLNLTIGNGLKVEYVDPLSGGTGPTDATGIDNPTNWGITPATYTAGTNSNMKTAIAASSPPPAPTDGKVEFLNAALNTTAVNFQEGDTIGLRVTDNDQNLNTGAADTLSVTVTNTTSGELETVSLTETGVNTGIFQGTLATSTSSADTGNISGKLYMVLGDNIKAEYTDPFTGSTSDNPSNPGPNANRDTATVVKIKTLYLSGSGDLDRIDPVATADGTTSTSAAVSPGGSISITDDFNTGLVYTGGSGWASGWVETGDVNNSKVVIASSPTTGAMQVITGGVTGNKLEFGGAINSNTNTTLYTMYIERAFSSTLASNASLDFDYKNVGMGTGGDSFAVQGWNGTAWYTIATIAPTQAESYGGDAGWTNFLTASSSVTVTKGGTVPTADTILSGTSKIRFAYSTNRIQTDEFDIDNLSISVAASAAPATFTQTIPLATDFTLPASGQINIVTYVSSESGLSSGTVSVAADLSYGATSIANLTSATYNSSTHTLTWTGELASGVTIPAGQSVKLVVTNNVASSSFAIDYDSTSKPSRIELPTTTVIDLADVDADSGNGIQEIGFYNNSYTNGGTLISSGTIDAGGIVYVRVKVSDPFGDYDINDLTINIDGPGATGDLGPITLTNANVIDANDNGPYKIYEYAWQTVNNTGAYSVNATAKEGYESITASSTGNLTVTALDLGTPSITQFITAVGADAGASYGVGSNAHLRITDLDENTNSATVETATATVNGIAVTLTETGVNTGIFEADLSNGATNSSPATFTNLAAGTALSASYVDNDDGTDNSSDSIIVPSVLAVAPVNTTPGAQTVREQVQTAISGLSVTDANSNLTSTRLTVTGGQLNVSLTGGASISAGANDSATLTLSGTETQIKAALATAKYTANNGTTSDTLTILSTDSTALTDTDTVSISVADAPENTTPVMQTVNELVQTSITGLSVTDTNGNLATTRLTVTGGLLNVTLNGAATISTGANNTASLTISGSETDINATLATLKYTATSGTTADTLTVFSSDSTATPLTDTDTVSINVSNLAFSIDDLTVNEAAGTMTFTVIKNGSTSLASSVDYVMANNTATAGVGNDYIAASGTLNFAAGDISKTITVAILNDTPAVFEGSENFNVNLSNAINAVISDSQGVGTIFDDGTGNGGADDDRTSFSVNDVSISEGGLMTFTVSRSGDAEASQSIDFATSITGADTAEVADFTGKSGTLTFAAGVSSQTFTVQTSQDSAYEGGETFIVTLANNSAGSIISDATGVGTILDDGTGPGPFNPGPGADDDRTGFSVNDVSISEGGLMTFTVSRSGDAEASQSVDFATSITGTDTAEVADFTGTSGTLTFAAGVSSQTFTVQTSQDSAYEGGETFIVTLANNSAGSIISDATGVGTILDDGTGPGPFNPGPGADDDRTGFSFNDVSISEGGLMTFTVSRSGDAEASQSIDFATSITGTDTAEVADFTGTSGTLTFAAGVTSQTFTVQTSQDSA
ncbi:MAG: hypothetical protein HGA96_07095, partial [Desulfobulbaceae bacterium]|nr:hypothetical protein [Desulfobulbaceae bacterium]